MRILFVLTAIIFQQARGFILTQINSFVLPAARQSYSMKLKDIHKAFKETLHIEDEDRIDALLAVVLSQKLDTIPLWIIFVGGSGDAKSASSNAVIASQFYVLHKINSKSLVNGMKNKKKFPDLAPKLDKKILLIPDMAQILQLHPNEKAEVWGQLRDLYDGNAGRECGGTSTRYSNLRVTLIANSTPAIDSQILIHQGLGTRELIYRTKGNRQQDELMEKCLDNSMKIKRLTTELNAKVVPFMHNLEFKDVELTHKVKDELKILSLFISRMRVTAEYDYSNELRNFVYPEEPTRVIQQLSIFYKCLKSLDKDYSDETAFRILWHIARSCASPMRIRVFTYMLENKDKQFTDRELSAGCGLGRNTIKRECSVLEALDLVKCTRIPIPKTESYSSHWEINDSNEYLIKFEHGLVHE